MEMKDFIWVTPNPEIVTRFIALPPRLNLGCDIWTEVYIGEKLLIHKSYLQVMLNRGFMIGDKGFIFDTWEEAENSPSKYKIKVTE